MEIRSGRHAVGGVPAPGSMWQTHHHFCCCRAEQDGALWAVLFIDQCCKSYFFFFSESFFKMNLNWTLICIKWKEKEWSAMKKVVSGASVPKGKLCSTLPSLQLASLSAALPKTGRKPQLVPCGVGGGGWVWRTEESLISKTVCSLTWQLNKRKCRNLARRGRTFGTKNTQFLIVSFQI